MACRMIKRLIHCYTLVILTKCTQVDYETSFVKKVKVVYGIDSAVGNTLYLTQKLQQKTQFLKDMKYGRRAQIAFF